ncbi:MAG: PQQ-dependent sugar dehydrogenase [Thermoproteota archaeon]|nr:PQQ-dependent sugar dehydrogenase [Thermoproteota archaeon]
MNRYYSAFSLAVTMMLILQSALLAFAQVSSSELFGCQQYGRSIHCDLLLNEIQVNEVRGNSSLVNPLTTSHLQFVNGKVGQALEMRGEYRESIEVMNSPQLNSKQFSISFWMQPTTIEPYGHIVSHSNRNQTAGWQFDLFKSGGGQPGSQVATLRFGVFNTNGTLFSPPEIQIRAGKFTLITGTFDGSKVSLYMDGSLVGETELLGQYNPDPGLPLRIGSAAYCASCNRWSGIIDELRMYDRTLRGDEIKQLFDMADVPQGLVTYWKFDGDTKDQFQRSDGTAITMLTSLVFAPDGRLFFTEKNTGEIRIMTPEYNILDNPFASVNDLYVSWEQGMLGLAIDPDFNINHHVYVYYTAVVGAENGDGGKVINRILRFTDNNNKGIEPTVIMDNIPASRGYHSGGAMAFGPDGKLYITVGDATEHIFAQDPSILIGKVLRINKDGTIPQDNPYPNSPVFTIGHRNMYGIAFDGNGTGLVTENGDVRYDEINLLVKGGNYGFPTSQPANLPPERANDSSIKPLRSYWDTIAPTQMIYYEGDAVPELKGMFLFGSFTGDIYALKLSEDKKSIVEELKIELSHFPFVPTVGIAQSPDGKIYYGGYQIYTLDSIGERKQILFPIEVNLPSAVTIKDISVDQDQKRILVDTNVNGSIASDAHLAIQIPTGLLENVTAVAIDSPQGSNAIEFNIDEFSPDYTTVNINIGSYISNDGDLKLVIY